MNYRPNLRLTEQQSKTITLIKGIAIIMVIMIHCDFRSRLPYEFSTSLDLYGQFLTRELVFNAVPLFFFVSGLLFFLKDESILIKWKKRIKTLLLPYLIWCSLYFLFLFFMQRVLGLESFFSGSGGGKLKLIRDFEFKDYFLMYWDIRDGGPILAPLWFLRNLIVLCVVAPVFKFLSDHLGFIFWALLLVNYLFFHYSFPPITDNNIFFFGSGVYLMTTKRKLSVIEYMRLGYILPVNIGLLVLTMFCYKTGSIYYQLSHNLFLISNSIFVFIIVGLLVSKFEMKKMFAISAASFFIYLAHEPWISYIQAFFYKSVHAPECVIAIMPWFFVTLAVCYTYAGYFLLKRYLPSVLNILTGAR